MVNIEDIPEIHDELVLADSRDTARDTTSERDSWVNDMRAHRDHPMYDSGYDPDEE